ncbi:uncharacterized protein QC761_0024380 [Podospora bellae-mahoneyi]|uniref:CHAT domain-containing protein n=1 Tax=Podospora bellae-mahoneyi TaxID=2093777 RepID=A0ABR0G209_9PEZI|nr:hypothetical protein QC761_0024380 [Podospora bellae-mahoneyi]
MNLNTAISNSEKAIQLIPETDRGLPDVFSNLSVFYTARYQYVTGSRQDLNQAIRTAEKAVNLTPEGDEDLPGRLSNLSNALAARHESKWKQEGDLDRAIAESEKAVRTADEATPDLYKLLNNLAQQLGERYVEQSKANDLDAAIQALHRAQERVPCEQLGNKATILQQLGVRLQDRYFHTGVLEDLDEAIQTTRRAVEMCPKDDKSFAIVVNALANRLGTRYTITWEEHDLDEAIRLAQNAVDLTRKGDTHHPMFLADLSNRLGYKYSRTGNNKDLQNAIENCKRSLELTESGESHEARRLGSLAILKYREYLATRHSDHLGSAIDCIRRAISISDPSHCHYPGWARELSVYLSHAGDDEESMQWAEIAVKNTPQGHPERSAWLIQLANLLLKRVGEDKALAKQHFLEAFYDEFCPIGERLMAGRCLLSNVKSLFIEQDDFETAYQVCKDSMGLISLFGPRHLSSTDKQNVLTLAVGLASEAAAIALELGKGPEQALRFLEDGRGRLLGSLYDLRSNVKAVEQQYPDLALQFTRLRDTLNTPSPATHESGSTASTLLAHERKRAGEFMDKVIDEIRSKPGFDQFLLPPSIDEALDAAKQGPIVVLNLSRLRSDALIIRSSGVDVLPLLGLSYEEVQMQSTKLVQDPDLGWLWDAVVGPVLEFLGFNATPADREWPRVWWIPTGALVKFPLHAAGHHLKPGSGTALDRAISSYSPSIKSIMHGRERNAVDNPAVPASEGRNLVLVSMEKTPGEKTLGNVPEEIATVESLGIAMNISGDSPPPNKASVLSALGNCRILHFAGHGSTHATQPLKSHLLLQDWQTDPLTVQSLLDIDLATNPPFLAYLSACGSGEVAHEKSVDESIHLTSAFQLAGFRHVIGTLWQVNDKVCVDMAREVYTTLKSEGLNDLAVSAGLHRATRQLRDEWVQKVHPEGFDTREGNRKGKVWIPPQKSKSVVVKKVDPLWVPYVHYGV